nr:hypothetical protein [uncultured Roseococcus sp.]
MDTPAELLSDIEIFLAERNMAHTTFGLLAVNDGKFVARLRERLNITSRTSAKVRAFLDLARAAPTEPPRPHRKAPQTNHPTQSAVVPQ